MLSNHQCSKPTFNHKINLHKTFPQKLSFPIIRASSSSSSSNPKSSLLKKTCIALTASMALFSATYFITRPGLRPPVVTAEEKSLETQSNDDEALLSLIKIKYKSLNFKEAIKILNRRIKIEPEVRKWQLMKARILSSSGQSKSAIKAFEEILKKEPNLVDAYHYLVMECYNSKPKLTELEKRINEAIRRCKKDTKKIRGFRMLIAQIMVIERNSDEAIRICEELVKEDPKDIMIYFFRGYVYALMDKVDEARKQYDQGIRILEEKYPNKHYWADANDDSEWKAIVAYNEFFCYTAVFIKLLKLKYS